VCIVVGTCVQEVRCSGANCAMRRCVSVVCGLCRDHSCDRVHFMIRFACLCEFPYHHACVLCKLSGQKQLELPYVLCSQTTALKVDVARSYPLSWQVYGSRSDICRCHRWRSLGRILARFPFRDDPVAFSSRSVTRYHCWFLPFFLSCPPKVKHVH